MGISELSGAAAFLENECLSVRCFKRLLENEGYHSNTEKNFKQLMLHAWLNRVGWVAESAIIIFSTRRFILNAFMKCFLTPHWVLCRTSKCCAVWQIIWSSNTQGQAHLSGVMTAEHHSTRWLKPQWRTKCGSKKTAKWCCVHWKVIRTLILSVPSTARLHCKLHIMEGWKKSFEETCPFP